MENYKMFNDDDIRQEIQQKIETLARVLYPELKKSIQVVRTENDIKVLDIGINQFGQVFGTEYRHEVNNWNDISLMHMSYTYEILKETGSFKEELKKEKNPYRRPQALQNPRYEYLINTIESYFNDLENNAVDDDAEHFIFEDACKAMYGENVFDYINSLTA